MKECLKCVIEKDESAFNPRRSWCKNCVQQDRRDKKEAYLHTASQITKTCNICNNEMAGTEFNFDMMQCHACVKAKNNRVANKPTSTMPDKVCVKCDCSKKAVDFRFRSNACIECEKNAMYQWRKENPDKFKEHLKKYRSSNDYKIKRQEKQREKYHTDIVFRLVTRCRNRVRDLIKFKNDGLHYELLGCSYQSLVDWLEFNFHDGMTWDNYGTLWQIDHIQPCASFDMTSEDNQKVCFNWSNLAPLDSSENARKKDAILPYYIEHYKNRADEFRDKNNIE